MGAIKEPPPTLLSSDRIDSIIQLIQKVNHLEGNIAEVGCYKGGTAYHLNKYSNGKNLYLFDTFEGIPMQGDYDLHKVGDFKDASYEKVKEYFEDSPNVKVVKGIFPDSADMILRDDPFCFAHLDADQHESTCDCLNFFYDKMVKGGIIVCDDFGWLPGVTKAVRDFFEGKEKIVSPTFAQCYIIKE